MIVFLAALPLFCNCSPRFEWRKHVIDGHMTGVTAVCTPDWNTCLGTVDSVYHAPNGVDFSCGATPAVARILIGVQPDMAYLKEILAVCPSGISKYSPESPLSNWAVDALMSGVGSVTRRRVDVGILNFGGIRLNVLEGNVLLDDIVSMFPFKNRLCYLSLSGADIRYLFDQMAQRRNPQCIGGARFVIRDGKACDITVGGEPLDDAAPYGVATIDFLLDGGDSLFVARNARDLIISDVVLADWMIRYIRTAGAGGEPLEYSTDGRIVME